MKVYTVTGTGEFAGCPFVFGSLKKAIIYIHSHKDIEGLDNIMTDIEIKSAVKNLAFYGQDITAIEGFDTGSLTLNVLEVQ